MKGTGKRVLSVSLAVMMALGMPSGTFAAAPDAEAFEQTSEAEVPVAEPETTAEVTQQAAQITENAETTKEPVTEEITQEEQVTESKQEKAEEVAGEVSETKDNAAEAETPNELPDLKVTKTELIETKEEYLVTVYTDSTVYDQLYVGKKEDTEKTPVVEGKKSTNGQYIFQFAVSEEKLGSKLQIVPGVKASGEWYTKEDVFCQVPEKTQHVSENEKTEDTKTVVQEDTQKEEEKPAVASEDSSTAENVIKAVYATEAGGDKAGTDYTMFKIAKSSAKLNADQIDIEIYVSPASNGSFTYDALYIGRWDDETKEPLVMGEVDTELNLEKFAFSVPAEKNGQEVIFVPRNGRTQKFSSSKIALKLPTLGSTDTDPEPTTAPSVPDGSKVENSITAEKADGSAFTMFNVEKSTATLHGENINIELYLKANASGKFSYTGIYLGSKEDEEKTPVIEGTINEDNNQVYKFSIPLSKAGTKLQFVPIKANGTFFSRADLYLTIPEFKDNGENPEPTTEPTETPDPDVTPSDTSKAQVIKADGTEFGMFQISTFEAKVNGDKIDLTVETTNKSFDKLYLGKNSDENKTPVISGTQDNGVWRFSFSVDKSLTGKAIPVVLGKPNGNWYSNQQLYLVVPEVKGSEDVELPEAGVTVEQGGTAATLNGFKVVSSSAKLSGDQVTVTFTVDGTIYDRIYLGKKDDSTKEPVVQGTQKDDQTTFTFQVSADQQGICVPITPGRTNGGWLNSGRNLFIKIPNVGKTFDAATYPNGIYDAYGNAHTQNSVFNIEDDSTITVKGDEVTVTLYSGSTSYDKMYIGKVGDSDEAKDANAVEGKLLGESDPSRPEYRVYTFSLKKSQLGTKVPFVLHNAKGTAKWLTKQDYLEIPQFMTKIGEIPEDLTYRKANITNKAKDFIINGEKSYYTVTSGALGHLVIATDSTDYNRMYLGTREEISQAIKSGNGGNYLSLWKLDNESYGFIHDGFTNEITGKTMSYVLYSTKTGKWSEGTYTLTIPSPGEMTEACTDVGEVISPVESYNDPYKDAKAPDIDTKPTETPTPAPSNVPSDGIYSTTAETGASMFKVVGVKLTVKNGKMSAVITLSGEGYDYLYMGTATDAATHTGNWIKYSGSAAYTLDGETKTGRTYEIPVSALDTPLTIASHSERQKKWYDRTVTISSKNLKKTGDIPAEGTPADGIYSTSAVTGAAMFKVVGTKLTVKNGKMTALITLSGIGYDYLYMGTGADAANHTDQWIKYKGTATYTLDGETKTGRTYEIPVAALDKPITVASHSESHKKWYDRTITFSSKDLKKIGDVSTGGNGNSGSTDNGTTGGNGSTNGSNNTTGNTTTKVDTKPDTESKYESDTSGSTKAVNSKTKLKDGVYKPDKFSWSGGSGRVNITCDKVTIKNGQALATIVFSSSAYQYVKANGKKYLPTHTGGKSIFVIPVELNKNNSIIGMTTKMSTAHEITYSILVYLSAADEAGDGSVSADGSSSGRNFGSNEKLDEKAPDIIGLEYKSETKLDYAKYFKIYHYDKDVTLLEIDMTKDTDKDPEKLKEETATKDSEKTSTKTDSKKNNKSGKKKAVKIAIKRDNEDSKKSDTQSITYNDEGEAVVQTQEEIIADLYKANVVKYLIVPEDSDVELPVGIEKEMIVIHLPVKHAYVDSEESLNTMDDLKLLKKIAAVGYDQDETDIEAVNKALEKEDMVYAGSADDLKFREIVKNKIDLAIVSSEILPGSETEKAVKEGKDGKTTKTDSTDKKTVDTTKKKDSKTVNDVTGDSETEATSVLDDLADNFATLGIPLIIDRSADEKSELAKAEWLKVYGAVFGCSKKTDQLYNKAVKAVKSKTK
ncbi:hypothetical protein LKD73_00115 [Fusicatenibacter sp. CLA-AA-H241]|nr:hypothetical protein [Oliverpabstia intestinalis]